jgi:hypothetical protein
VLLLVTIPDNLNRGVGLVALRSVPTMPETFRPDHITIDVACRVRHATDDESNMVGVNDDDPINDCHDFIIVQEALRDDGSLNRIVESRDDDPNPVGFNVIIHFEFNAIGSGLAFPSH